MTFSFPICKIEVVLPVLDYVQHEMLTVFNA